MFDGENASANSARPLSDRAAAAERAGPCGRGHASILAAKMSSMDADVHDRFARKRRSRAALWAVWLTGAACVAALLFRAPLRSRYWAWRLQHATNPTDCALYLGALCSAGDHARWGVAALLARPEPELRQDALLVLQRIQAPWAREQLVTCLSDRDPDVQRLAALGLAMQGDEAVIPTLKWLYQTGDATAADTACLALQRLATREAVRVLAELSVEPADPERRGALADALGSVGQAECVPALLQLLADDRIVATMTHADEMSRRASAALRGVGYAVGATSQPESHPAARTVAERAAVGLARITRLDPPFNSAAPAEARAAAERIWTDWYARHLARP